MKDLQIGRTGNGAARGRMEEATVRPCTAGEILFRLGLPQHSRAEDQAESRLKGALYCAQCNMSIGTGQSAYLVRVARGPLGNLGLVHANCLNGAPPLALAEYLAELRQQLCPAETAPAVDAGKHAPVSQNGAPRPGSREEKPRFIKKPLQLRRPRT